MVFLTTYDKIQDIKVDDWNWDKIFSRGSEELETWKLVIFWYSQKTNHWYFFNIPLTLYWGKITNLIIFFSAAIDFGRKIQEWKTF